MRDRLVANSNDKAIKIPTVLQEEASLVTKTKIARSDEK
jgi:hypothetical protein